MSSEMNKSPMEVKCEELAEDYVMYQPSTRDHTYTLLQMSLSHQEGFKAALELPEVKALVDALELATSQLEETHNLFYSDGLDNSIALSMTMPALKSWKSFKGE